MEVASAVNKVFIIPGSNGLPLRTDPDAHSRFRILFSIVPTTAIVPMTAVIPMAAIIFAVVIIPAASVAGKNAAGSGEQGKNA